MSKKKLLLITFDYELFLGKRSGTPDQCLIQPTQQLLTCLNKFKCKALFFIDTVYLLRLQEMVALHTQAACDFEQIKNQLIQVVQSGHEIHPHVHPHWLDARYHSDTNEWDLSEKKHYTVASISESKRKELFDQSVGFIQSVLDAVNVQQPVDCYRAGGWSIQPFKVFSPLFVQHGIKHEWSVIPGKYQISDAHSFDFSEAPVQNPVYHFDEDPCREKKNGPFTEWTISSIKLNRFETWFDFKVSGLLNRMGKRPALKGNTVSSAIKEEGDKYNSNGRRIIASFEGLNPFNLKKYIHAVNKAGYFQFISHPKLITPYEFGMIEKMFRILTDQFEIQTDFRESVFV